MRNANGNVKIIGPGPLSNTFRIIEQDDGYRYMVWTNTLRYRLDDKAHPLDVIS